MLDKEIFLDTIALVTLTYLNHLSLSQKLICIFDLINIIFFVLKNFLITPENCFSTSVLKQGASELLQRNLAAGH